MLLHEHDEMAFKVLSEEPTLQGLLRTHTTALYHPGKGEKRGPKRNRKRTQETASKRQNTLKLKCKRVIGAEMSRETLSEKKKLKMKEHRA